MKRKVIGLALGTVLAASLAACGNGDDNNANGGNDAANNNAANNTADNAENNADDAAENNADNEAADVNENAENDAEEDNEAAGDIGGTYTVATDSNYVPFEFLNTDTGEMEGFDIDLINAIADEAGFEIELEVVEFDGIVSGMGTGRYDIGIAGMTITEERAENFEFSNPYYSAGLILAVQEGEEDIQSIDDVDGLRVATRAATTSETYLQENTEAEIVAFPDIVNAYQDLQAGRVDAAIYDLPNVLYYIDTEGVGDEMQTVGDTLTGEQYGIAFPEGSELREAVNEALQTLMDDGTYGEIYEEWFGEEPNLDTLADSPEEAMNLEADDMEDENEVDVDVDEEEVDNNADANDAEENEEE
ncbi:extracellular solute-binding protein, family 3 [Alkalicoccus daliensis]|uniref:Extracellular solute-binding protein, family 3 n=1 Tax=Alkalicoccus daliensis TaxID=745820 RepID=A0A1H0EVH7_9BACI|nr:transporter substrate-binding domain-containing protein [Alkalicoccus daliensis]SDN86394.1 extracellular solute-binding protein, family 3 [Alkalicoccus daliensis]